MKNKILLILVLLIPSLCFGLSIKMQILYIPERNELMIVTYESAKNYRLANIKKLDPKGMPQNFGVRYKVNPDNGLVDFSDKYNELTQYIISRFATEDKEIQQVVKREIVKSCSQPMHWNNFEDYLTTVGAYSNYQISIVETPFRKGEYRTTIFFYKPDK